MATSHSANPDADRVAPDLASPAPGPTAGQVIQACILVNQIAEIADMLHGIAVTMVAEAGEDSVRAPLSVRYLSAQLGWLADLAVTKLGDQPLKSAAEEWMLPPLYHQYDSELPFPETLHRETNHA
jgi:hypothetical protein